MKSAQSETIIKGPVEVAARGLVNALLDRGLMTPDEIEAAMEGHDLASIQMSSARRPPVAAEADGFSGCHQETEFGNLVIGNYEILIASRRRNGHVSLGTAA